jgi:hypothetical protein
MKIRKATTDDAEPASLVLRRSTIELCLSDHENDPAILGSWLANKTLEHFREWAGAADDSVVSLQPMMVRYWELPTCRGPARLDSTIFLLTSASRVSAAP